MKHFSFHIPHMKFKTRILCFLLLCVLTISLLVSVVASHISTTQLRRRAMDGWQDLLTASAVQVENYLDSVDDMSYALMYNRTVQTVLAASSRPSMSLSAVYAYQRSLYYALLLQASIDSNLEISVHPLDASGSSFYSQPTNFISSEYDFTQAEWYLRFAQDEELKKQYLINKDVSYQMSSERGPAHIAAYRVNYSGSFRQIGYLCVYIRPEALEAFLTGLSADVLGIVLVDDESREIIAGSVPDSLRPVLLEGGFQHGQVAEIGGEHCVLMEQKLEELGWSILCAYDFSPVRRQSAQRTVTLIGLALLLVALSFPLLVFFTRRMFAPIEELIIGMEMVKMGKYDVSLPKGGRDELGGLLVSMNDTIKQLDEASRKVEALHALQRQSDYKALHQQINPHFLYNTLNMVIGMATVRDNDAIIEVCKLLADMFRSNLRSDHHVSLGQELEQISRYIRISQYRFRDLFDVVYDVDESLRSQMIPRMTLQPVIENSILHGFAESGQQGVLTISAQRTPDGGMCIAVSDTGRGMSSSERTLLMDSLIDADILPGKRAHVGLHNVYARLRMEYGEGFAFAVDSTEGEGTDVRITLPLKEL